MRLFPRHWSRPRRIGLGLLAALFTLMALVALVVAVLFGTESGRLWLVGKGTDLFGGGRLQIATEGVSSPALGRWHFDRIALRRDGELWVDIRELSLHFVPGETLFRRRVLVKEVGAETVFFYPEAGNPAPPQAQGPTDEGGGALPSIAVESFWLDRFALRGAETTVPDLMLEGDLRLFWDSLPLQLDLQIESLGDQNEPKTQLQLSSHAASEERLQLRGSLQESPQGWLGAQLQLPPGEGIDAEFAATVVAPDSAAGRYQVDLETLAFPLVSHQLQLEGQLAYQPDQTRLLIDRLRLNTGEQTHEINGTASSEQLDLAVSLDQFPLSLVDPWVPQLNAGHLSAQLSVQGSPTAPVIAGDLQGETSYADLPVLLDLTGAFSRQEVEVARLSLNLGEAALQAQGVLNLGDQQSDLTFTAADLPASYLGRLGLQVPEGLTATLTEAAGRVTGTLEDPQGELEASVDGEYQDQEFALQVNAEGNRRTVEVRNLQLLLDEASIRAKGTMDIEGSHSDLAVELNSLPVQLAELGGIELPPGLAAEISGTAHLQGSVTQPDVAADLRAAGQYQDQEFSLTVVGQGGRQQVALETAALKVGEARLEAEGIVDLQGNGTSIAVALDNAPLELAELAQVELPDQLSGRASGTAQVSGALTAPQVVAHLLAEGSYGELEYTVVTDASLVDRQLDIARLLLQVDGNTAIAVDGYLTPEEYDLMVEINDLPTQTLSALGWDLVTGDFNGDLHIKGTPQQPAINGAFTYSGEMRGRDLATGESTSFELDWTTQIETLDQVLQLESEFRRSGQQTGQFELEVPITRYLEHFRAADPDASLPLAFSANGAIDLAVLSLVLDPDIHRISGRAALRMEATGDLAEPTVDGVFELLNTRYENTLTGTYFHDIQMLLRSQGNRIEVVEAIAQGRGNGSMALEGTVSWRDPQNPDAVDLVLIAKSANLIDRDELDGEVSGELALTGSFEEMLLAGELDVTPLEANIGGTFQSSVPTIEVTEVYGDEEEPLFEEGESAMPTVNLNIMIEADQQAFLRGRGLEAELEGEIELTGTLAKPVYEGEFSVVRGIFEVFGRKFMLDQGQVLFANNAIFMRIPGTWEQGDYTIRAELSGTVEDLDLSFSSTPPLPEDEILSLVIFGESADSISPFQALRLASAIQTLRGGGGGFDLLGSTRETLGVDRLSVESASTESGTGVAVGVGKYLTDDVYLELKRTPSEIQPWQGSLEIQLTPRLHLKSTTGGEGQTGAELLWKRDF